MAEARIVQALDLLKQGKLQVGASFDAAHEICQENEGSAMFDWVHALVHRIEGDDANAAYWYRRAGRARHPGSIEEEWHEIRRAAETM